MGNFKRIDMSCLVWRVAFVNSVRTGMIATKTDGLLRGGSWYATTGYLRVANRLDLYPDK